MPLGTGLQLGTLAGCADVAVAASRVLAFGTPLQDPIASTTHRLLRLDQGILTTSALGAAGSNLGPPGDRLREVL